MSVSVLFLCTGNSARSQMAEVILKTLGKGRIDVSSAGSRPQPEIHPMAHVAVRKLLDAEMVGQYPKSLNDFLDRRFDYVITVCDRAAEACPIFPGDPERIHWGFEDPAAFQGTSEEQQRAFHRIANEIAGRIRTWLSLQSVQAKLGT